MQYLICLLVYAILLGINIIIWTLTVIPCGSLPLNVKVENLDEFDYVLHWEKKAGCARFQKYFFEMIQEGEVVVPPNLPDLIKKVLINSAMKNLSDIQLFQQNHAVNIKFS